MSIYIILFWINIIELISINVQFFNLCIFINLFNLLILFN